MTLHSTLCFGTNRIKISKKTELELNNKWAGVDYLFIDEVSIISCEFLAEISEVLTTAQNNMRPFGGLSVIFAGDFSQLPPIAGTPLFHSQHSDSKKKESTETQRGLQRLTGRVLWQGLTHCVLLHRQMRQTGSENELFCQLLGRVATNKCTDDYYYTLCDRVIDLKRGNATVLEDWDTVPIITRHNRVKNTLTAVCKIVGARARFTKSCQKHANKD